MNLIHEEIILIVDELLERVRGPAEDRTVVDVRIGLRYTAVKLDNGAGGVAFTFAGEAGGGCSVARQAGSLCGRPAQEAVEWCRELDAVSASVGLATLNALVEFDGPAEEVDVRDLIRVRPGDVVGMVGYFGPLVGMLRCCNVELHIFERRPVDEPDVRADWAAPLVLPGCDVVILSATTLANRTGR